MNSSNHADYGPGESFDGNPFGKPGQDFRKISKAEEESKEKERLERLCAAADIPVPPQPMEEPPDPELPPTCSGCSLQ